MALKGNQARIFLDGFDLSCTTSQVAVETTTGEYDATTLCSTVNEYRPGLNQGKITVDGYFTGVMPGEAEARLYASLGATNKLVAVIFDYANLPAPAYVAENASNLELKWAVPTDGLITMNGSFRGALGVKRSKILTYQASRTATGLGVTGQLVGVTSGMTGRIYAFVHGVTGTQSGNITMNVQSSANGISGWSTEASFSFAAPGGQGAALTTPAGEYFNINVTGMGGVTAFTTSLIVSIDGLTT